MRGEGIFGLLYKIRWLVLFAIFVAVPLLISDPYLLHLIILGLMYSVLAASWNLTLGYLGVFNFGHIAFFAIGAYASSIFSRTFGVTPWLTIFFGAGVAAASGVLICLPVLRLKGVYVALVTYAFSELGHYSAYGLGDLTGGSSGLVGLPTFHILGSTFDRFGEVGYYYVAVCLFVTFITTMWYLIKSNFGLSIIALRDAESYATSRGVSRTRQRLLIFLVSAFIAGIMGAFSAHYNRVVYPGLFGMGYSCDILSMVILGGPGTFYGPIVAAFLLTFLIEFMQDLGPYRFLISSTLIILVVIFRPGGLSSLLEYGGEVVQRLGNKIFQNGLYKSERW